jgi:hypothetical protein
MDLREIEWGGMDWINLAQDSDQWRALVNTIMNLRDQYNAGTFLSSYMAVSQEGLSSMKLVFMSGDPSVFGT